MASMFTLAPAVLAVGLAGSGLELRTTAGAPFSLADLLARGPVVVVLWNSWLPGTEEFAALLPEVERAAEAKGLHGVIVIFQDETREAEKRLPHGLRWPVVTDGRGELARELRISKAPVVLVLRPDRTVEERGGPDPEEVRKLVQVWSRP
jgi:thiol-disulfide isomerase/thioredoxin